MFSEDRRKHFIFTLHNVNNDQKEALAQMRLPNQTKAFFETLPILKALKTLADVQKSSSGKKNFLALLWILWIDVK